MRVLVVTASKHGATAEIGQAIAGELVARGVDASARSSDDEVPPDGYDAVVLGSAVYAGRWLPAAKAFVERFGAVLRGRPVYLFSSGPVGDPPTPEEEPVDAAPMVEAGRALALGGARRLEVQTRLLTERFPDPREPDLLAQIRVVGRRPPDAGSATSPRRTAYRSAPAVR